MSRTDRGYCVFEAGAPEVVDEGGGWKDGGDTVLHPTGWHYEDGTVRIPLGLDAEAYILPDGRVRVYHDEGGRCL